MTAINISIEQVNEKIKHFDLICLEYNPSKTDINQKSKFFCKICNREFLSRYQDIVKRNARYCACGALKLVFRMDDMIKNKTKIGMLTPVKYLGKVEGRSVWKFQCDCGGTIELNSSRLTGRYR